MGELELREFSDELYAIVNSKPFPMEFKRLALRDVLNQVEKATEKLLKEERESREAEAAKAESEVKQDGAD